MLLARAGVETSLLDRPAPGVRIGEGLPPAARPFLSRLGLIDRMDGHLPSPGNRSWWGSEASHEVDFVMQPFGDGWHLDRERFDAMLRDAAIEAGARCLDRRVVSSSPGWTLHLDDGSPCMADLVIDCSGRSARFARDRGAARTRLDALVCAAAVIDVDEHDHDATTLVEAGEDGWWYSALIPARRRVVAFLTDADLLPKSPTLPALLGASRQVRQKCLTAAADVRVLPAETARLDPIDGDGWMAAGDAAFAFDPVSSYGILAAMQSGRLAAESLLGTITAAERREAMAEMFNDYLRRRAECYAAETRFDTSFWRRRRRGSARAGLRSSE
jgi:flavin-dependent dehydrogenase